MSEFRGRRVTVIGLGISGEASARVLAEGGAHVTITDSAGDDRVRDRAGLIAGIDVRLSDDGAEAAAGADLVVVSPGVRPDAPAVASATARGIPVWTEVELAYRIAPGPGRLIGVTGTNGKTTTTEMITAALRAAGVRASAAGNIGRPLVDAVRTADEVIVVELSSFQLHYVEQFRTHIGVLLNIADDHLDWHGSAGAYVAAKSRLFANQQPGDVAVHLDDEDCARAAATGGGARVPFSVNALPHGGAGVAEGWIVVPQGRVVETARLRVRGRAMLANAVAAAAAACAFGAGVEAAGEALGAFGGQPHRMEEVGTVGRVVFVNDSKATNPHATLAALEDMRDVVLIAGGRNKGLDLSALAHAREALSAVVGLGEAAHEVIAAFGGIASARASTMDDAVEIAASLARPGGTVLLSPACASFDMFTDYKARGEAFRAAVKRLAGRGGDDA